MPSAHRLATQESDSTHQCAWDRCPRLTFIKVSRHLSEFQNYRPQSCENRTISYVKIYDIAKKISKIVKFVHELNLSYIKIYDITKKNWQNSQVRP
jgi:hypothetical protein